MVTVLYDERYQAVFLDESKPDVVSADNDRWEYPRNVSRRFVRVTCLAFK